MGVYDDRGIRKKSGKKKRARKACFHCRQSHLSCGDCRPCPRCTKKGLNCVDTAPTHKVSKRAARSPSPASDDQEYSPTSPVATPQQQQQQQQQEPVYQQPQYRDPFPLETNPTDEPFYSTLFSPSTPLLYTTLPVERFDTTMTNSMSVLAEELRQLRGLVSQQQHMINRLATRVEPEDSYDSQVQNSPVSHTSGSEDKIERLAHYMNNIVPNLTSIMICVCDRRTREILAYNKALEDQMKIKASGRELHTIYDLDHPDMRSYMKDLLDAALQSVPHYRGPIVRVLTTNAMLVDCTGSVIPVRTTIHVESDIFWLEYVKISQNLVMDDSFELNGRAYPKRTEVSSMFDLISKITFMTSTIEQEKANAVVKYL